MSFISRQIVTKTLVSSHVIGELGVKVFSLRWVIFPIFPSVSYYVYIFFQPSLAQPLESVSMCDDNVFELVKLDPQRRSLDAHFRLIKHYGKYMLRCLCCVVLCQAICWQIKPLAALRTSCLNDLRAERIAYYRLLWAHFPSFSPELFVFFIDGGAEKLLCAAGSRFLRLRLTQPEFCSRYEWFWV